MTVNQMITLLCIHRGFGAAESACATTADDVKFLEKRGLIIRATIERGPNSRTMTPDPNGNDWMVSAAGVSKVLYAVGTMESGW